MCSGYYPQITNGKKMNNKNQDTNDILLNAAIYYIDEYRRSPKNFIACFKKFKSVRGMCGLIADYVGDIPVPDEMKKKITRWVDKHEMDNNEKKIFASMLFLFYDILNQSKHDCKTTDN